MNKKHLFFLLTIIICVVAVVTGGVMIYKSKNKIPRYNLPQYEETATAFAASCDDSVPLSFTPELKNNPDRGYRGELYLTLGSEKAYPSNDDGNAYEHLNASEEKYKEENVKNYQLYVYLIEFCDKDLTDEALAQLTEYLEVIKSKGLRVMLRFAYEYDSAIKEGPTSKRIIGHTQQLKEWFADNESLVNETVYAMQLGMIGLWGEGHNSYKRHNPEEIINAVFEMVPDNMTVMMRTPAFIDATPEKYMNRVSIHDDFLVGIEHPWGMLPFNHPDNKTLYTLGQHTLNDGEMPWGRDKTVPIIDSDLFLLQCKNYGFNTLSCEHNYKEDGNEYALQKWKSEMLNSQRLEKLGLPYFPSALNNGEISIYDYLDYHLGYLLCATNMKVIDNKISFDIMNYGLAAPIDFKMEIKTKGEVQQVDFDTSSLTQFGSQHFEFECGDDFSVAFRHIRDKSLAAKFANDVPFENGFNLIYTK